LLLVERSEIANISTVMDQFLHTGISKILI
jgi:hypothetical protein